MGVGHADLWKESSGQMSKGRLHPAKEFIRNRVENQALCHKNKLSKNVRTRHGAGR